MRKILMMLTNARRDCAQLALELLVAGGSMRVFDHVVFLLNGVSESHMHFVDGFIRRHPDTAFDKILGPGTRPDGISWMQNQCIERYPESLYMKIDEDVFVPPGWAEAMVDAYRQNRHRDRLALISPLLPNNAMGLHQLLTVFYPDLLDGFRARFRQEPSPERAGFTWHSPGVAEWATRCFLDVAQSNIQQRQRLAELGADRFLPFRRPFSIGCICYDYQHWIEMGGIPRTDEPGWCEWVESHDAVHVLDRSLIALHYSFFVQQEWLDRTSLLEDLRALNRPGTIGLLGRRTRRWVRLARQTPGILKRRLGRA